VQIEGSTHKHASLEALVAFYQNPEYFASSAKVDVPAELLVPAEALYEELPLFWRDGADGATAGAPAPDAEMQYEEVTPLDHDDGSGAEAAQGRQGGGAAAVESHYAELSPWNVMEDIKRNHAGKQTTCMDAMRALDRYCKADLLAEGKQAVEYAELHPHLGTLRRAGAAALTVDDIAAIYMYTKPIDFFSRLNQALGGYLAGAQLKSVEDFLPFTKLLVAALDKLPRYTGKLFRGAKMNYEDLLRKGIGEKDVASWNQFISCSPTASVLKEEAFLGTTSPGTVFQVISVTGVAIRQYSALPNENEVLLPAGSKFVVDKISQKTAHGVTEVRMRQLML